MEIGKLVFTFFNTAGPGGVMVMLVLGGALTTYYLLTRWIIAGGAGNEPHQPLNMDS
jgi:hypothetical protein